MDHSDPLAFSENEEVTSFFKSEGLLSSEISSPPPLNKFEDAELENQMGVPNTWAEAFPSPGGVPALPGPLPDGMPLLELQTESGPFNSPENSTMFTVEPGPLMEDIKDPQATPGLCGLRNLGNTCFLNAGLQCLLNNQTFMSFFLSGRQTILPRSLTAHFVEVAAKVWSGGYTVLNVTDFKEKLGKCHPQFQDFRQHDCQEFLALLLDTLHEQLNTASLAAFDEDCTATLPAAADDDMSFDDKTVEFDPNETRSDPTTDYDEEEEEEQPAEETPSDTDAEHSTTPSSASQKPPLPVPSMSDNSSHSTSPHSTDSLDSWKLNGNFRFLPIPDSVKPFKDIAGSSHKPASHAAATNPQDHPEAHSSKSQVCDTSLENIIPIEKLSRGKSFTGSLKRGASYLSSTEDAGGTSRKLEKNELATQQLNSCLKHMPSLEDFVKDSKTLNTNVLVSQEEVNNQLKFDSEKYPRTPRPKETVDNLGMESKLEKLAPLKETNLLKSPDAGASALLPPEESIHSKRIKLSNEPETTTKEEEEEDSTDSVCSTGDVFMKCPADPSVLEEEADSEWAKYRSKNQSIVVETFQGQFQSTVVCAECGHISVTYEPFMYLPVPLPHALERQVVVTYVPRGGLQPTRYLAQVHKNDKVVKLRESMLQFLDNSVELMLAEVRESYITKIIDDHSLVRYINDQTKDIYAFEVAPPPERVPVGPSGDGTPTLSCPRTCVICLEELSTAEMLVHPPCECVLCLNCIELSCNHFGRETMSCPVCNAPVKPQEEFLPISSLGEQAFSVSSVVNVALVFRVDDPEVNVIGHPALLRLPSTLPAAMLYEHVDKCVPYMVPYSVLFVNEQGKRCSRCRFSTMCTGCEVARVGEVALRSESLAVRLESRPPSIPQPLDHCSMSLRRDHLTLYDCLNAFAQSETLDEHNPWNCPRCRRNQRAMKSLALWRCPDTLMVYLKRFVFQELASTKVDDKVTFPLESLDLSAYVAGPAQPYLYNLQACICHFGGMSSGHYTAYAKHAVSGDWYYFNDDVLSKQAPRDEDSMNAYILFYQKPGTATTDTPPPFFQSEFVNGILKALDTSGLL